MINEILNTLNTNEVSKSFYERGLNHESYKNFLKNQLIKQREDFFPTDQYSHNFENPKFLEFNRRQKLISKELSKILPPNKYDIVTRYGVRPNIAWTPWIGIQSLDENFDASSKRGVYMTILWKVDGSGISLSLQTGTDESNQKEIRWMVENVRKEFSRDHIFSSKIDLKNYPSAKRPKNYEIGNIIGKDYDSTNLQSISDDILIMERIYDSIINQTKQKDKLAKVIESEESNYQKPPKFRKTTITNQLARDPKIKDAALAKANHKCELDSSHETFIVDGVQFMEGHHLVPLEEQRKFPAVSLDFQDNIVSLCPNCHSEIHFAESNRRIELVSKLFKARQHLISNFIEISNEQICTMYSN
jgi:5-methylcytosine-specific restriction protein A